MKDYMIKINVTKIKEKLIKLFCPPYYGYYKGNKLMKEDRIWWEGVEKRKAILEGLVKKYGSINAVSLEEFEREAGITKIRDDLSSIGGCPPYISE